MIDNHCLLIDYRGMKKDKALILHEKNEEYRQTLYEISDLIVKDKPLSKSQIKLLKKLANEGVYYALLVYGIYCYCIEKSKEAADYWFNKFLRNASNEDLLVGSGNLYMLQGDSFLMAWGDRLVFTSADNGEEVSNAILDASADKEPDA